MSSNEPLSETPAGPELAPSQPAPDQPVTEKPRRRGGRDGWILGAVLIVIGLAFLAGNLTGFRLNNWWALFILIPAFGSLAGAWRDYRANGRLTRAGRGPLIGGLILLAVTLIFLFEVNWGSIWPIFLIIGGIGLLLSAL